MSDQRRRLTHAQWLEQATALFGPDEKTWRFVCPVCKVETSVQQWIDAGAQEGGIAFSCIGRYTGGRGTMMQKAVAQPCNYAGGGFFPLNPVTVEFPDGKTRGVFEFAPAQHLSFDGPRDTGVAHLPEGSVTVLDGEHQT